MRIQPFRRMFLVALIASATLVVPAGTSADISDGTTRALVPGAERGWVVPPAGIPLPLVIDTGWVNAPDAPAFGMSNQTVPPLAAVGGPIVTELGSDSPDDG